MAMRILLMLGCVAAVGADSLSRGDAAYKERRNPKRARQALEDYRQALKEGKDAGWRLAMAAQFVGHRLESDREEKRKIFAEGRDAAAAAARQNPECGPCHFWEGIDRAQYGEATGIFQTIVTLKLVVDSLERAAEIDGGYAYGGPYRILGLIRQKLPGILGGSNDEAERFLEKAIAAAPDNPINYVFLARLERDEKKDRAAFLKVMERAKQKVARPADSEVESFEAWGELAELRRGVQKR